MANWRLYDVGATTYHTLVGFEIKNKLRGLNVVKGALLHNVSIADNTLVEIYDPNSTKVFTGFTKKANKPSDTTLNKYDVTERVIELVDYLCEDSGDYEYTYTSDSVNTIIDDILTGTGWTRGSSDTTVLDYVSMTYAKKLSALFYILREQRSHEVWFNNATKTVYFGVYRTDRSGTNIDYIRKEDKSVALKHNVDKVIVIGNTNSIVGEAGSPGKIAAFQYKEAGTSSECTRIATQLLAELGSSKTSEKVYLAPTVTYEEGDKIKVDGNVYVVFDVSIKMEGTTLVVGSTEETILEAFDGKLREITGSIEVGENSVSSYDGGEQNVGSTVLAKYRVQIDDVNLVNSFKLVGKLGKWKKSLATGLEGTGLGVNNDYALPDNTPNDTGLTVDDENLITRAFPSTLSSVSNSTFNFSSQFTPSSGWSDHAWSLAHGSINVFSGQDDSIFYVQVSYYDTAWRLACQSAYTRLMNGQRCTVDVTGLAPGSTSSGSRLWRITATQVGVGNLTVDAYELGVTFMSLHDHGTTEANHDHAAVDLGHDHNTTETDHDHPETNNLTEIDNFPANVVIKVNSTTVGTWNSATNGQVVTVSDIKAQLTTGLNEITVSSTKAVSIYLGGEVEMVLL